MKQKKKQTESRKSTLFLCKKTRKINIFFRFIGKNLDWKREANLLLFISK